MHRLTNFDLTNLILFLNYDSFVRICLKQRQPISWYRYSGIDITIQDFNKDLDDSKEYN